MMPFCSATYPALISVCLNTPYLRPMEGKCRFLSDVEYLGYPTWSRTHLCGPKSQHLGLGSGG